MYPKERVNENNILKQPDFGDYAPFENFM